MFAEYLKNETWQQIVPGVSACLLEDSSLQGEIPLVQRPQFSEAFFCTGGSMTLFCRSGAEILLEARGILLISQLSQLEKIEITEPLCGIFLSFDHALAGESFQGLCHHFGNLPLSFQKIRDQMQQVGGFRAIPVSPWTRGTFYALKRLPREEQTHYCSLKTFELLYLFCNQSREAVPESQRGGSLMNTASAMKAYMEGHLDEKLTISNLSYRFHLSRTACKSAFRSCYGQPIHSWLLDRRMERAAELLEKTKMPILQVAQSVGYTGVSQFNVAFRQRYGKSPREYRKMSLSAAF